MMPSFFSPAKKEAKKSHLGNAMYMAFIMGFSRDVSLLGEFECESLNVS